MMVIFKYIWKLDFLLEFVMASEWLPDVITENSLVIQVISVNKHKFTGLNYLDVALEYTVLQRKYS